MAYYKGKDSSDAFIDPDYERLRRDRNLLKLELDRLNKINTKLNLEIAQNKVKLVTFDRLLEAIDREYEDNHCPTDFSKYLYDTAHHFDDADEQNCDETDDILQENCDENDLF